MTPVVVALFVAAVAAITGSFVVGARSRSTPLAAHVLLGIGLALVVVLWYVVLRYKA